MSLPEGTVVFWYDPMVKHDRYGVVQSSAGSQRLTLVKMDDGTYDPESWPDGIIFVNNDKLRVLK